MSSLAKSEEQLVMCDVTALHRVRTMRAALRLTTVGAPGLRRAGQRGGPHVGHERAVERGPRRAPHAPSRSFCLGCRVLLGTPSLEVT